MLFRVWNKKNNCYTKEPIRINSNGDIFYQELRSFSYGAPWYMSDDYEVEFNTGIKLADGTETFFGDIIRRPLPGGTWKSIDQKHFDFYEYILITKENLFEIIHKYTNGNILYDYFEMVGNIHETELTDTMKVWIEG